jgi:opacity protein-like surface antigen
MVMKQRLLVAAASVVILVAAVATASAQSASKGYVQALGGATFGTETSWMIGGGAGVTVAKHVQIIGEFGYMRDVLPSSLHDALDAELRDMSGMYGVSVTVDMKVRALYGAGGARFLLPGSAKVTPYVDVTAGLAHLTPHIVVAAQGSTVDASSDADLNVNKPLMGLGGGVDIAMSHRVGLQLGYQYTRIFTGDPDINTHRATAGVSVRF